MNFIIVRDTDIVAVNRGKKENESSGIIYRDNTGSLHEIDFHTCALNYKAEHNYASDYCIGERKSDEMYFLFYTSGIKTKVVFQKHYVVDPFCFHPLKGSKASRFHSLQELICETNFSTCDLS
ncbi:MAG: hypothetical protein IJY18_06310 [Clostridia bacterium]|nr:hypothetical protein [Clostridia bacterium]